MIDLRKEMLTPAAFFMPTRQPITFSKRITILSFLPKQILLTSSAANEDNVNQSSLKSTYLKGFIQKRKRSEKNDFVTTAIVSLSSGASEHCFLKCHLTLLLHFFSLQKPEKIIIRTLNYMPLPKISSQNFLLLEKIHFPTGILI